MHSPPSSGSKKQESSGSTTGKSSGSRKETAKDINMLRTGRLGITLRWYIARELIRPTVLALGGLSALVLTKDMLGFSDLVINRGFGLSAVAIIAFYELLPLLSQTLPFAVLVGALVGLGRLKSDFEILSMEAAGISGRRLVYPVCLYTTALMVIGLLLSLFAAPWATRSLAATLQRMAAENPGLSLRSGTVYDFSKVKMVAREVSARGDQLRGVLLWIPEPGQIIFAERGELSPLNTETTQLALYDGVMLPAPPQRNEETRFGTYYYTLQENPTPPQKEVELLAGAPTGELRAIMATTSDQRTALRARVEWHRRIAYPAAAVAFGVLAVALVVVSLRFSRAAGGVSGLIATVVYYGLTQLGEGLIYTSLVPVWCGVWAPNILVILFALLLFWHRGRWIVLSQKASRESTTDGEHAQARPIPHTGRYILQRYVARQYLPLMLLSLGLLFVGYLLVDVLERLQWFARHQASAFDVLRFYGARSPLLLSRVLPMALLLAAALTVSLLSANREIIAMRACGVAVARALAPILLIAAFFIPASLWLNEEIVPKTNAHADRLKDEEIKNKGPEANLKRQMIWYQDNTHLYQATQLNPKLGEAQGLSIYELGENGLPTSRTDARIARHVGNGVWELTDPVRIGISDQGLQTLPATSRAQLGEAPSTTLDTMHLNVRQLKKGIRDAEASGYNATPYRVDLYTKLAAPLACFLLPTVALFFAITGPPFPGPAVTILVSSSLGVGYILLTGVSTSLGYGAALPPLLAGWGPSLVLVILTLALANRNR
jgi:lipopolysaccharide export system permease protein